MARVIVRFRDSPRGGLARCAVGPELAKACHTVAVSALGHARANSPGGFGGYAEKFEIIDEVIPDIPHRQGGDPPLPRVSSTLVNRSELAVLVEVGGPKSQEYRVLTKTLAWLEAQAKA